MENIIITGGAGYIGSYLSNYLEKYFNIIIIDILYNSNTTLIKNKNYTFIKGDINDYNLINDIFKKYNPVIIIHTAALSYVNESFDLPDKYYINNVVGTLNILNSMISNNIKNLIFSSSCSIYGNENKPISPYANTKLICETMIKDFSEKYNIKYIIFRYFNVAGANINKKLGEYHTNEEKRIIPLIINKCINGDVLYINGNDYDTKDGTVIRDYIHIEDLSKAHKLAIDYLLDKTKKESQIMDLGTGQPTSLLELIQLTEKISKQKIKFMFREKIKGDPVTVIADNNKCKNLFNFIPNYNIEDIINSTYKWLLYVKNNKI